MLTDVEKQTGADFALPERAETDEGLRQVLTAIETAQQDMRAGRVAPERSAEETSERVKAIDLS
jgi:hypothetical protein